MALSFKYFYWIIGFLIICIGGFRWETGTDWLPYLEYFHCDNISFYDALLLRTGFEPAYAIIVWFSRFFSSYSFVLCMVAFLSIFPKLIIIGYEKYYWVGMLLFFAYYCGDIFAVRQNVAIALCFYSFLSITKKQKTKFFFTVLLACSFHVSSIIFFPAYYIANMRINKKNYVVVLLCTLLLGMFFFLFISVLLSKIAAFLPGGQNILLKKLVIYLNPDSFTISNKFFVYLKGIFLRFVFFFFFYKHYSKIEQCDKNFVIKWNLWFTSIVLYVVLVPFSNVFTRFVSFYSIFEILLFCSLFRVVRKTEKIMFYCFIVIYSGYQLYRYLSYYWDLFVPYYSIIIPGTRALY